MCRLAIYQGPPIAIADLFTRPAHSLIHQSFKAQERREPLNGDGFGVAWYAPGHPEPATFRDTTPAWNNDNLVNLARVTASATILGHVRAATHGIVSRNNCHPFTAGRYAFMHNGSLKGFDRIRRRLLAELSDDAFALIRGNTDTEHIFALFVDRLADQAAADPLDRMADALVATLVHAARYAMEAEAASHLNLVATDGERTVACRVVLAGDPERAQTLYLRRLEGDQRYRCDDGVCSIDAIDDGEGKASVLIASEPLFEREAWTAVPPNHLVRVDAHRQVQLSPIEALAPFGGPSR